MLHMKLPIAGFRRGLRTSLGGSSRLRLVQHECDEEHLATGCALLAPLCEGPHNRMQCAACSDDRTHAPPACTQNVIILIVMMVPHGPVKDV